MRRAGVFAAALAGLCAVSLVSGATAALAALSRSSLEAAERGLNREISALWPQDPFLLLGTARGVYLAGYGAVFTAEVDLAPAPGISPFHQSMTAQDVASHKKTLLERLPKLKKEMARMLVGVASSLDTVPATENVVLGITLTPHAWENRDGIPSQIVMSGERGQLVDAQRTGRMDAAVKETEF